MMTAVIGIAILLGVGWAICAVRYKRRCERLSQQIQAFLLGGRLPAYSVKDDTFSLLENAVIDLENKLLLERQNTEARGRENADFVADISHQLKTPLAALKLYSELDAGRYPASHAEKQLVLLERMETLIHSLLRLENLRANAYTMQFAPCELCDIVSDVWNELRVLYPHKRCNISGRAVLRCDAAWMREALMNILKNSCEHTPEDGWLSVQIEQTAASVSVTVRDNGGGVPEEELPLLFRRFFHSSHSQNKNSAGIGLAFTREIITKHHGTVCAQNGAEGLCVHICLPVIDAVQAC